MSEVIQSLEELGEQAQETASEEAAISGPEQRRDELQREIYDVREPAVRDHLVEVRKVEHPYVSRAAASKQAQQAERVHVNLLDLQQRNETMERDRLHPADDVMLLEPPEGDSLIQARIRHGISGHPR